MSEGSRRPMFSPGSVLVGDASASTGSRHGGPVLGLSLALAATLGLASMVVVPVNAHGQSAKSWAKRGADAELHEDYDAAFEAYRQALLQKPQNLIYKTKFERIRFAAAAAHVDRGRVLRQSGDLNGALTEFQRALAIDGGNQTAQQESLAVEREMSNAPGAAMLQQAPIGPSAAATSVAGPIQLKPVSNDLNTLHMVEDTKVIYQALGKAAGINVIFDPDYTSRRIPIDLVNVSLYDALRIVGTLSGTFWKPVTANTIFVAANTTTKRQELDTVAIQTFYISNAASAQDANELLTALRNVLDPQTKIFLVPSQNAIVMRSTPDQLLLVETLLNNLDRPRSEVVVDVAVLEVNKTRTRNLGITLPQNVQLGTQLGGTSSTLNSSSATNGTGTTTGTTTTGTTTNPSLNDLANFTASNIAVNIGTAAVNALLTDSDTRILQNPRVRATDGQRAQLKIGSRIPIATGSFSNGLGGGALSGIGAVNTQFTYIDIGVNIDMTPTVHQDREITLKMHLEISSQNGQVVISGVQQPIIGQRSVDQTIQLKEGEPSILAGLLTRDEERSVSGTPGIANVPLLNKVLGSNTKVNTDDEIVFLLIPHIVREPLITRLNTRAIDSGTSTHFELRHDDALAAAMPADTSALVTTGAFQRQQINPTSMTAAQAASKMIGQVGNEQAERAAQGAANVQMGQQTAGTDAVQRAATGNNAAAAAAGVTPVRFLVSPANSVQTVGSTFQVSVGVTNAKDLYAAPMQLQFDPKVLSLVNVDSGEMLARDGQAVSVVHRDEGNGKVTVSVSRPPSVRGVDGQGSVAVLTFKAVAAGDATLSLVQVGAKNSAQANVPAEGSQSVVHVK